MLNQLITRFPDIMTTLNDAWKALGTEDIALHPPSYGPGGAELVAPVGDLGCLAVSFGGKPVPSAASVLLNTQAALLTEILQREQELKGMTAELMRSYDQLVAMYHVSQASRSQLDPEAALQSMIEQATQLVGARSGFVALSEGADKTAECVVQSAPRPEHVPIASGICARMREIDQPIICNSAEECGTLLHRAPVQLRRVTAVPVRIGGELAGFLCLLDKATDFDAGDLKLLAALADQGGALLERDRLYRRLVTQERMRRELEIAAEIQTGLLPRTVPQIAGVDLAGASRPATEVGGDFFDFLTTSEGCVSVILGDVTSKGVPAALFMAVTRSILRAALPHFETPQNALARLNADLYQDLSSASMFVTLFVAHYDPLSGLVTATNAGHSPVFLCQSGQVALWEADGPLIGVLPDLISEDQTRRLAPGDILVAMSDGFNEARNSEGEMLGLEPLVETIAARAAQPAVAIKSALLETVARHTQGRPLDDDQTIVVLKAETASVDASGTHED